ncbi:MAG: hypothetical protein SCH98_13505 [Deferrisomatales bacterium]|nr:hypothetical protein [Deferrisomatales bacterium]
MKMKIFIPAALVLSLLAGGCAAPRPTATLAQHVPVEARKTSPVTVSKAQAIRQDGKVLVSGSLERPIRVRMPGHVDVLFLRPDGSPIAEKQIQVPALRSKRHGKQMMQFRASLDLELPEGASAIFAYHAPPF